MIDHLDLARAGHEVKTGERLENEQRQVLANRERQQHAFRVPVAGQIDDAVIFGGDRIGRRYRSAPDKNFSGNRGKTRERADEIALAVALDAGESDHFSRYDLQVDALQDLTADVAGQQQGLSLIVSRRLVGKSPLHGAPDDQRQDFLFRHACGIERPVEAAVAQDADPIGDAAYFGQAMRNVDDGSAVRFDPRYLREQPLGFGGRQRFGRFVEHENFGP